MKYKKTIKMGGLEFQHTRNGLMITKTAETTADEMFAKIGYEKKKANKREIIYRDVEFKEDIEFDLNYKMVFCPFGIEMHELQAIIKKCQELGWM